MILEVKLADDERVHGRSDAGITCAPEHLLKKFGVGLPIADEQDFAPENPGWIDHRLTPLSGAAAWLCRRRALTFSP
jgi:hypothetical protein